jgi:K+-sensing histidine kinase KdpD
VITAAGLAPLLACAVLSAFRDSITTATAVLVLVLLVVAAASTDVRAAGIVAAVSGGVWFDFFLTEPYERLAINDRNDIEAALLLVVIGIAVTEVALWGHRAQARANRRAGYLDGVLGTAEIVTLRKESPQDVIEHIGDQIKRILDIDECRFVAGPVHDPRIPVLDHQGHVTRRGHVVDVDRDGMPSDDTTALLLTRAEVTLGYYQLTAAGKVSRPTLEQRKVAVLLADQVGSLLAEPRS